MKKWIKVLLITIIFAIITSFLGPKLWPPSTEMSPTKTQLPYFIFISIIESISFGLGISFIIFGWPIIKKVQSQHKNKAILSFISIIWLLTSWWPHDNFHISNGSNMQRLLYIEYGFHLTLIIASVIIAYNFLIFLKESKK